MLTLLLNTQKPQYRLWPARKRSLILAHDNPRIYHTPTYVAVPLLGRLDPTNHDIYMIYREYTASVKTSKNPKVFAVTALVNQYRGLILIFQSIWWVGQSYTIIRDFYLTKGKDLYSDCLNSNKFEFDYLTGQTTMAAELGCPTAAHG